MSFDPNSPPPWQKTVVPAPAVEATSYSTGSPDSTSWTLPPLPFSSGELLAWLVILGFSSLLFITNVMSEPDAKKRDFNQPASEVTNAELAGKMFFFLEKNAPQFGAESNIEQLLDQLDSGPLEQRYCQVLAINEFMGPEEALNQLYELDELTEEAGYQPNERQKRLREVVGRLLEGREDGNAPSEILNSEDQEYLTRQLRWFGQLAMNPADLRGSGRAQVEEKATRGAMVLAGWMLLVLGMLLAGFFGLGGFLISWARGSLISWLPDRVGTGPIYAETFAIWLVGFFSAQLLLGGAIGQLGLGLHIQMLALPTIFFLSLIALAWPLFRGLSWARVRQDIGWTGERPISDLFSGLMAYVSGVPLMGLSLLATLIVAAFLVTRTTEHELAGSPGPIHPIVGYIASGDWFVIALIFISTCIAAPIVEETMFRGVLFRSLRDRTAGWGRFSSVAFSALINSLIFAAIHPQGAFGIPVLTTLAVGFSLVRQWRGSLIAPIFMHALNNFLVTTFAVLLMS